MKQSINFINVLPKQENRVTLSLMSVIICSLIGVLFLLSLFMSINVFRAYSTLVESENNYRIVHTEYLKVATKYPLLAKDIPLINQVTELENRYYVEHKQFLSIVHLIVRPGFSKYMQGLAYGAPISLWLSRIIINHAHNKIILSGFALQPDTVSDLMSELLITEPFDKVLFSSFFVRTVKSHPYMKFAISTHNLELNAKEPSIEVNKTNINEVTASP